MNNRFDSRPMYGPPLPGSGEHDFNSVLHDLMRDIRNINDDPEYETDVDNYFDKKNLEHIELYFNLYKALDKEQIPKPANFKIEDMSNINNYLNDDNNTVIDKKNVLNIYEIINMTIINNNPDLKHIFITKMDNFFIRIGQEKNTIENKQAWKNIFETITGVTTDTWNF